MLVGPWQGGHSPTSKCSAARELDADPKCPSLSCSEPSCNTTSGKSRGTEREALGAALPLLGGNKGMHPSVPGHHGLPAGKAEFIGLSSHQQCQILPGAIQVKHDAAPQHSKVVASLSPGKGGPWVLHSQTPVSPRARAALQSRAQETSWTFAQGSTHMSLSSVHSPAPGADARGRGEGVSQPHNIRAALPDQSKGLASPPKLAPQETYKTRANTRDISPKCSSALKQCLPVNPQWVSALQPYPLLPFLAPPHCV